MRYSRFVINNFKGVRDVDLDIAKPPRPPVFALVGLNESGKTTILEAIHWLHSPNGYDETQLIPKGHLANFNGEISTAATIELSDEDEQEISEFLKKAKRFITTVPIRSVVKKRVYTYKHSVKVNETLLYEITVIGKAPRMRDPRQLAADDPIHADLSEHIESNLIPPIIYYENFLFDFPDKIYLQANPPQELSRQDNIYRGIIQDVLNSIDPALQIQTHIIDRHTVGGSALRALESVLLQLASKMTSEVFTTWKELLKIDVSGTMEITLGQKLSEDAKGLFVEVKLKEGDQSFLIRERSLGFRWFFAFILFTHFRAFRYSPQKKTLFLLDEPASNLHPTAQSKLIEIFERFPNNQDVIYATHSHHMINPKWLAGTFVIKNEAKHYGPIDVNYSAQLTKITAERYFQFAAKYPNDTDYFRPILDMLDYQLSSLEHAPEIVILEGKYDYYTLRFMSDLGYAPSEVAQHLAPGTGKDKVDYLVTLYIGWARNFVVLLDDDSGGRQTYNRLFKDFGPILDKRIFRLVHISKEWKGFDMEKLFSSEDWTKVMAPIYPGQKSFDKSKFHLALQDSLANNRKVDLKAHTIANFKKLFAFLETKLAENRA